MQANAMSNVEFTTIVWDETLFKNTFETVWRIVQTVVSHQKPLALFRKIASLPAFSEIGATEPLKYTDTRYGIRVFMGRRLLATRSIYRNLMVEMGQIFDTVLQVLRVSDGMKGGTPDILYNMCLVLDNSF